MTTSPTTSATSTPTPGAARETEGMTLQQLTAFSDAWTARDVDTLMSFMSEDCVYSASVGPEPGRTYTGREEVRAGFVEMLAHDTGRERRGGAAYVFGDRGVGLWSFLEHDDDGTEREIKGCDVFEFDGDKIRRKDAYRKTTG